MLTHKRSRLSLVLHAIVLLVALLALGCDQASGPPAVEPPTASNETILRAFGDKQSNVSVIGEGVVARILADDNDGSRHQRVILRIGADLTVLIAHSIDLAPRLAPLKTGDVVAFAGIYEWNAQGGVVHWTHRDPEGPPAAGWLRHNGRTVQ